MSERITVHKVASWNSSLHVVPKICIRMPKTIFAEFDTHIYMDPKVFSVTNCFAVVLLEKFELFIYFHQIVKERLNWW